VLRDGFCQCFQLQLVKVLPGLTGIRLYFMGWQQLVGGIFVGFHGKIAKKRAQTFSKTLL
jgi:hypothetical protein